MERLNMGIVGVGGRPNAFLSTLNKSKRTRIAAVCDIDYEAMTKAIEGFEDIKTYTDYQEMLEEVDLDAIIIGTPMPLHASQSIAALKRNIHVFSEVTAAISVSECKMIVGACKNSKGQYMMGENSNYKKEYMIVKNMVQEGLLGEVYYAEGEYLHDCRHLWDKTPWRREMKKRCGITYGTHSLGPVLSWFEGDRVDRVCCIGSGHRNRDLQGRPIECEDGYVMLCKTIKGRLIKIRFDGISPGPYTLRHTLQGTKGVFEGGLFGGYRQGESQRYSNKVWIEGKDGGKYWEEISKYEEKYLPKIWKDYELEAKMGSHSGTDVIIINDFIDSIYEGKKVPIDVHASMDMTLPDLISQESVAQGGKWVKVPNSREW
jgi:predicted dehydrogenase